MSVFMNGKYLGNKRLEIIHEDSGTKIITDAPKDNQGEGQSFSPTDLACASLASCVLTTIAIAAEGRDLDLSGSHFRVEKIMAKDPRRIGEIDIAMHMPAHLSDSQRKLLEDIGNACPVQRSLSPMTEVKMGYIYDV